MGQCCRRHQSPGSEALEHWEDLSAASETSRWTPPMTSRQRRETASTRSMSEEELARIAADVTLPAATREYVQAELNRR